MTELAPLTPLVPGVAGVIVALSVYRLSVVNRDDAWLRTLWDFHRAFWQDEKMERVRAWIACDEAYKEVQLVLSKRVQDILQPNAPQPTVTADEYKLLEMIDCCAALLIGYARISPAKHTTHRQARQRFYDSYWIVQITQTRRRELYIYLNHFFPELWVAV